jgi:hypothetical protein
MQVVSNWVQVKAILEELDNGRCDVGEVRSKGGAVGTVSVISDGNTGSRARTMLAGPGDT